MTNRYTVATLLAATVVITSTAVSAAAQDAWEVKRGSTVNITTCIVPSLDDDDEFVLTNIVDLPAHPPIAGQVVYWINDVKKIKPFVGQRIQFTATIKDVDRREIEVKKTSLNGNGNGSRNGGSLVEIEGPGNQVKARPELIGYSAENQTVKEVDVPTTLVELKLHDNITRVTGSCSASAALMTASAASVTETAITETSRAAAEVAVDTRATVTTPEVAVETARTEVAAAREVPVETAAMETRAARTELPRTSTALPLAGLLGLGSLLGAAALRLRRR